MKKKVFFLLIFFYTLNISAENNILQNLRKFQNVYKLIKRNHISNPENSELFKNAIKGLIKTLDDPYTVYMEKEKKEDFEEDIKANFGGLGILLGTYTDNSGDTYLQILEVLDIENCPAKLAGIKSNDIILKINDINAKNIGFETAKEHLRGPVGSEVILTIKRFSYSETEPIKIKVIRDNIEIPKAYSKMLSDSIGYIRLISFTEPSPGQVQEKIEKLMSKGANSIIFDLRSNPGGLLSAAVDIVSLFIPKDKLVVYTKNKDNEIIKKFSSTGNKICDLPLVLLINEYSASASEIVTGALKSYNRAYIIGKKSFGKGSVQRIFPLNDGSGLKLTIARYFTPDDKCIDKIGIHPHKKQNFISKNSDDQLECAKNFLKAYSILKIKKSLR